MLAQEPTLRRAVAHAQTVDGARMDPFWRHRSLRRPAVGPADAQHVTRDRCDFPTDGWSASAVAGEPAAIFQPLRLAPNPWRGPDLLPRKMRAELLCARLISTAGIQRRQARQAFAADLEDALPELRAAFSAFTALDDLNLHSEERIYHPSDPSCLLVCHQLLHPKSTDCMHAIGVDLRIGLARRRIVGELACALHVHNEPQGSWVLDRRDTVANDERSVNQTKRALLHP
mmetsp:Transcript_7803/g.18028  ORF Transcript_7803/g.18028 Transcript_7803/m.18028 type:complete len:230 (+) Transcript_7803:999-1688(+)